MTQQDLYSSSADINISFQDLINFIQESWKKLAIAAIVGAILGLANWGFLSGYQAEYVLLNKNYDGNALDLYSWKTNQKSLPNLAAKIEDQGRAPEDLAQFYKTLASEQWWRTNVVPSYAISKADTKDFLAIGKDLGLASTNILNLTLKAEGPTKDIAIDNVRAAANFLRTGSAYLQLRNILNDLEAQTTFTIAELQRAITVIEIEMGYQVSRAKTLEDLHKRFPGGNNNSYQVIDVKESSAKYMPLVTQIIAVNNDINQSKESLIRLRDRLSQIAQIKLFLQEASPLIEKTYDGVLLGDELLALEVKMRAKLSQDDIKQQEVLDQLRIQFLLVKRYVTNSFDVNTAPTVSKKGMIKSIASGCAGAFSLMLLVLLGQRVWSIIKSNAKSIGA